VPFPLLAHQVVVLPLKLWRARWIDTTALVLGSIAPDLQNFATVARTDIGHSLRGQFVFCLPLTMILVVWIGALRLGDVFASRFSPRGAWLAGAATDAVTPVGFLRAITSALVGSFSHLALDALTHRVLPPRLPRLHFRIGQIAFGTSAVVQILASLILGALAIVVIRRLLARDAHAPPARRSGAAWIVAGALVGSVFGAVHAAPAMRHPDWYFQAGRVYVWGFAAFLVLASAALGALIAATPLAIVDRRAPK